MSQKKPLGLTCVYKNGDCQYLTGDAVTAAYRDGWKDTPQPKKKESKPKSKD